MVVGVKLLIDLEYTKELKKHTQDKSILLVEDDHSAVSVLAKILSRYFHKVLVAKDGMEGLEAYSRNIETLDIVVSDITMPYMNGIELSKEIRRLRPKQKIIIISSHNETDNLLGAIEAGVNSFIIKPIDTKILLTKLAEICEEIDMQKSAEKQQELERILAEQNKLAALGEMIGIISHQLKQPLNGMSIMCEALRIKVQKGEKLDADSVGEIVDKARGYVDFMNSTITTFKNFLQPTSRNTKFKLSTAINNVANILIPQFQLYSIDLSIDCVEDSEIMGFESEFKNVILNMINNSKEAIISNKSKVRLIEIRIYKEEKNAIVRIKDTGGGIPKEKIDTIFKKHISEKRSGNMGIGLNIAKAIISEKLKGDITFQNTELGVEFTIAIPAL